MGVVDPRAAPALQKAPEGELGDLAVTSLLLFATLHAASSHRRINRLNFLEGQVLVAVAVEPALALLPSEVACSRIRPSVAFARIFASLTLFVSYDYK